MATTCILKTLHIISTHKTLKLSLPKSLKLSTKMTNLLQNLTKTLLKCFTHCLNCWDTHVSNSMTTLMSSLNKCYSKPINMTLKVYCSYSSQSEMLPFGLPKTINLLNKDFKLKSWIISKSPLPEIVIYWTSVSRYSPFSFSLKTKTLLNIKKSTIPFLT